MAASENERTAMELTKEAVLNMLRGLDDDGDGTISGEEQAPHTAHVHDNSNSEAEGRLR